MCGQEGSSQGNVFAESRGWGFTNRGWSKACRVPGVGVDHRGFLSRDRSVMERLLEMVPYLKPKQDSCRVNYNLLVSKRSGPCSLSSWKATS